MIMDDLLEIADAATITTSGTALVGDQIDRQAAGLDFGNGQPIYLVINVDTAITTAGTASTLQFVLVSDDTASIHATTRSSHLLTPTYLVDDDPTIPAGTQLFCCALPICNDYINFSAAGVPVTSASNGGQYERYLGVQSVVGAAAALNAGKVNIFLTYDPHGWKAYADATN